VEIVKKKENKRDWLIHKNIEVKGYKQIIDNIINQMEPIDLEEKSTSGFNSTQYGLLEHQDLFLEIQEKVVSEIYDPSIEHSSGKIRLTEAWTVLGHENSYHTAHSHLTKINLSSSNAPTNKFSTVLYLDVPKNPNMHQPGSFYFFLLDEYLNLLHNEIHPKIGDLIIMPVHITHGVYPQSKGLRQTLNMDFEII
jgi:hypothetical protein